jgi:DNA-binding beta-propeller fold protein YncE
MLATACSVMLFAGCATTSIETIASVPATDLVWPAPPSEQRISYVMSFGGAEDLGIKKRFLQRLGVFVSGRRQERLVRPMAVAQSPGNRYFVADPGVRGVHLFDRRKDRYRLIQRDDGGPLPSPVGLAAGSLGEVYVTDSRLAALFLIMPGADAATRVPLDAILAQPTGIALDKPSGRIYLVDTGSHEVKIFARDGALLRRIGGRGTAPGKFNYPTAIWMTEAGEFIVADSLNFRTQTFDAEGNFLSEFGAAGDGAGFQPQSKGIATDSHGHVYVSDSALHAVQIFDASGKFLYRLGFRGVGRGEFWLPAGIFIGEDDTIFVADSYNSRVQIFRYSGGGVE